MGFRFEDGLRWNDALFDPPGRLGRQLPGLLLPHGGDEVVWQDTADYLLGRLLADPTVSPGDRARTAPGMPSRCHENAAVRASDGEQVVTGWALSGDGLWLRHSWTLADGRLVETTVPRDCYVGVVLDDVETLLFALNEGCGERLVAADPDRWLPLVAQLVDAAGDLELPDGPSWDLAARLRPSTG